MTAITTRPSPIRSRIIVIGRRRKCAVSIVGKLRQRVVAEESEASAKTPAQSEAHTIELGTRRRFEVEDVSGKGVGAHNCAW